MKTNHLKYIIAFLIFVSLQLSTQTLKAQSDSVKVIYEFADEMPVFPGGQEALNQFFDSAIQYPEFAFENNIQGIVILAMLIDKDGNVKNIKIKKDIGAGCGKEAERVARLMPKWTPGKQNGKGVNFAINVPVKFAITKELRKSRKKKK